MNTRRYTGNCKKVNTHADRGYSRQLTAAIPPYVICSTIGYHSNSWASCIFRIVVAYAYKRYDRIVCENNTIYIYPVSFSCF